MENPEQLTLLFEKYIAGSCSIEETQRLMDFFHVKEDQELLKEMVIAALDMQDDNYRDNPVIAGVVARVDEDLFKQIQANQESRSSKGVVKLWPRIAAAAAIVLVVGAGVLLYRNQTNKVVQATAYVNDVAPGSIGATLTLASGKQITLSDAMNGELTKEAGLSISKTADGQLVYEVKDQAKAGANKINTLSTAKGETYQVRLPDGSLVMLNAASSLTYATSLNERGERRVKLIGEAYFEIFKDKSHPFIVESKGQQVEVLGTHFNINAYADEPIVKTTLAEGSIRLTALGKSLLLKPNQEATLYNGAIEIKEVDAELALAWKGGFFLFNRESLESIMAKIARWYDVEVVYNDSSLKSETFTGTISRFEKISQVFNVLERTGVAKFKIEGKKITIDKMK